MFNKKEVDDNNFYLFFKHFILMKILYILQFYFYSKFSFYLFISPLKIILKKIPQDDQCMEFIYYKGDFCKFKVDENSNGNCIFHFKKKTNLPSINSLREYYFDISNIYKVSEKVLEKILETYYYFAINEKKYFELLEYFGLSPNNSIDDLKFVFRERIKKITDSNIKRELIENYNLLKNLFL